MFRHKIVSEAEIVLRSKMNNRFHFENASNVFASLQEFKNATITGYFGFKENSVRESHDHRGFIISEKL